MNELEKLLFEKGSIITDIEILQAQAKQLESRLGPINQSLTRILNEKQQDAARTGPAKEAAVA